MPSSMRIKCEPYQLTIVRFLDADTLYGVAVPGKEFFTTCDPVQKPDANTP